MLELKINKKDISLDPFKIVAWEDQELALALFATKPIGKEEDRVNSRLRILIGEEKAVLARIRGEKTALQKARVKVYTLGGLSKEFCRQFVLADRRVFHVGSRAYSELAEDIRQRQGYEVGVIYDETFEDHHFLDYFTSGYSDYRRALQLFKAAIRGRDAIPASLSGEEPLREYLREMYNTASPLNKYMSLLIWMQYCRCAAEFDRQTRDRLTDEAIEKVTRLAGGFWDGDQPQPQGDKLSPDDPVLGGTLPEDRRDWRLRTENGDGIEGDWMLLNGSFQCLKRQYVTNVAECSVYFRKCICCGKWFVAYHSKMTTCSDTCAARRKKQTDVENRKRKQGIPGYEEKRKRITQLNEWKDWAKAHSTGDVWAEMSGYSDELSALWDGYHKSYEAEVDPDAQEQLSRKFRQKMRNIARKAEDKYNEYKRLAALQQ